MFKPSRQISRCDECSISCKQDFKLWDLTEYWTLVCQCSMSLRTQKMVGHYSLTYLHNGIDVTDMDENRTVPPLMTLLYGLL